MNLYCNDYCRDMEHTAFVMDWHRFPQNSSLKYLSSLSIVEQWNGKHFYFPTPLGILASRCWQWDTRHKKALGLLLVWFLLEGGKVEEPGERIEGKLNWDKNKLWSLDAWGSIPEYIFTMTFGKKFNLSVIKLLHI